MSVPAFHSAFDPASGLGFTCLRAYWLGRCSELVYPHTEEERAADHKAREARMREKALSPPWWRRWRRRATTAEFERARSAAEAAITGIASTEAARIEQAVRGWGFDQVQFMSGVSTQCFIAASNDMVILCFRGTEPNRQWDVYDDLMALPMRYPEAHGQVHGGFWTALEQVWGGEAGAPLVWPAETNGTRVKGVPDYLHEFRGGQRLPVWITGHSLGGALATVAAARLVGEGVLEADDIAGVYTFGQPRVGDPEFAEAYELADRHFRIVRSNDVVTRVPPASLRQAVDVVGAFLDSGPEGQAGGQLLARLRYDHVGKMAFLSYRGRVMVDPSVWELLLRRFGARLGALFKSGPWLPRILPGIADHAMSGYTNALKSAATSGGKGGSMGGQAKGVARKTDAGGSVATTPPLWTSVFAGVGLGLMVGTLLGLAAPNKESTVAIFIGAAGAALAAMLGLHDRHFSAAKALRIGAFGFATVAGAAGGIYARTHDLLSPDTVTLQASRDTTPSSPHRLTELFSGRISSDDCVLVSGIGGKDPKHEKVIENFISFGKEGGWRDFAKTVSATALTAADKTSLLLITRDAACSDPALKLTSQECEALKTGDMAAAAGDGELQTVLNRIQEDVSESHRKTALRHLAAVLCASES